MKKWLLVACLATAGVSQAETLTLEQSLERALSHDPRISELERITEAAQALEKEAGAHMGVKVETNSFLGIAPAVSGGFFEGDGCSPASAECEVRNDRYDLDLRDGLSLWAFFQFSIVKPLYTFGKVEHYSAAAKSNIKIKEADVRIQQGSTIIDVKTAYYGHLTAKSTRLFLEDVHRRVESTEALITQWLEEGEGTVTQADQYAVLAAKSLVSAYVAQASALESISLDGLKVLTGVGLENQLSLADQGISPLPLPSGELNVWLEKALANRPEMQQVEHGLRASRELVEANKSMQRPNVYAGISGMASYSPGRDRIDNPYVYDPFNDYGASPVIGLQWSWDPQVQSARITRAKAEANAVVEKASFARQGIPFQVAEQYRQVHAMHESVKALEQGAKAGRRWMISSYTDFEAGLNTADKVVTAFQGYVLAYTEYLKTVYAYNLHVAKLEQMAGAY